MYIPPLALCSEMSRIRPEIVSLASFWKNNDREKVDCLIWSCISSTLWESQRPRPTDAQGEQLSASVETEAETYLHHLDASLLCIPRLHDNCIRCC